VELVAIGEHGARIVTAGARSPGFRRCLGGWVLE